MQPNLSADLLEMRRADILRAQAQSHPRPERRPRRRLSLRWRRRAGRHGRRVAPA